jgi:hypothetical protein
LKTPFGQGLAAGLIGAIAINVVEFILRLINLSETTLWQAGGIFFLSEEAMQTPLGIAIGVLTHIFVALLVGIIISYFLFYSGTDFAIMKGITISLLSLFITLGIVFPLRGLAAEMQDNPSDVLSAFIDHVVFGALAGFIIRYFQREKQGNR